MAVENINGRRIGISRNGEGDPSLMLHCALAHRGALAPLMSNLPARAFTAFDLPGHGESEFDQSADIQAQAVETAESLLEASGPADVFGHSFGATVALKLALKRPDLVKTLSLYEPVYISVLATANPAAYAEETQDSAAFAKACQAQNWPAAARAFLARWGMEDFDNLPDMQKAYILKTMPLIVATQPTIMGPESGAALLRDLPNLQIPTLLMRGEFTPKVISEVATVLAQTSKNIKKITIKNAGHMGPITHAAKVAKRISTQTT